MPEPRDESGQGLLEDLIGACRMTHESNVVLLETVKSMGRRLDAIEAALPGGCGDQTSHTGDGG